MKYRCLDHTSDLGLEIFGKDLPELFRNAGFALFDNIVDLSAVVARESQHMELHSATREELFLDWLRELLFRFSSEYFVVKEVTDVRIARGQEPGVRGQGSGGETKSEVRNQKLEVRSPDREWSLEAAVRGEKFDPQRHRVKIEIKTPTYHMFSITQDANGYKATVIFDV